MYSFLLVAVIAIIVVRVIMLSWMIRGMLCRDARCKT
jgi:hypothetical protein